MKETELIFRARFELLLPGSLSSHHLIALVRIRYPGVFSKVIKIAKDFVDLANFEIKSDSVSLETVDSK